MSQTSPAWAVEVVRNSARRLAWAAQRVTEITPAIVEVAEAASQRLRDGGKILAFGNGGSAACAQHFAAEFPGKLSLDRRPLSAIALTTDTSGLTAIANDYGFEAVFERQVIALAGPHDVVIGLSTSGTSANVLRGLAAASQAGALTVMLSGPTSPAPVDHLLAVGIGETARIQEAHDLVLHCLAGIIERTLLDDLADDRSIDRHPFVLNEGDIGTFRDWLRSSGQTLVTTNGVFDLLHTGHRASLDEASRLGDRLVVLVNSDESVRRYKGPNRPIRTLAERIRDLEGIPCVDHVVVMPDDDPIRLLGLVQPEVHCKGADYAKTGVPEQDVVAAHGGRMHYLRLVEGHSTTKQEERLRSDGN